MGLCLVTLAVYAPIIRHQFINLDDDIYIYQNPMVVAGLSSKGLVWAFTTFHAANWHPLTWLSHMLDVQLFGLNPGLHLAINALLHSLNTLLLFTVFRSSTQCIWRSAVVAALFALHPIHVESVAWAAERKDVLSAFFALLSLLAYVSYAKKTKRNWKQFLPVMLFLTLSLLSKPMFVTWPFVMLLLDYWPLNRIEWRPGDPFGRLMREATPLVIEKIWLFVLIAASASVTYIAQSRGGSVRPFVDAPASLRIANALVSYAKYLIALLWPTGLGVYYPFPPEGIPIWQVIAGAGLLGVITIWVIRSMRTREYLFAGWAWYVGTLIPVIGLVQVGGQAMADRYTYIPSVGLFLILAWFAGDLLAKRRTPIKVAAAITFACLAIFASLTVIQISFWRDSITLYRHTLLAAPNNLVVNYNLAHTLGAQGDLNGAAAHFEEALRLKPDFADALINLGVTLKQQGKFDEASGYLMRALEVNPESSKAHLELGVALAQTGRSDESLQQLYRALELAPNDFAVRTNLGLMLARQQKLREAGEQLTEAIRLNPNSPEAHNNLGLVMFMRGETERSISEFATALRLNPNFRLAEENLNRAQAQLKSKGE